MTVARAGGRFTQPDTPCGGRRRSRRATGGGFSLLEVSVVLVAIAVLLGAVMTGANVMRSAQAQRKYTDFVLGWRAAYLAYLTASHNVQPGDDPTDPAYAIGGAPDTPLCGTSLINTMLARAVTLPDGRGPGLADRQVYNDPSGAPHELAVCLETVNWSVPGPTVGTYQLAPRHVLRLTGLTPELAMSFDATTDVHVDARFGEFREDAWSKALVPDSQPWSADGTKTMKDLPEGASVEVVAYLLLGK